MTTPNMVDYLEKIYFLIENKGYARVIDIANLLHIKSSSATRMIRKLADNDLVIYEKYRGFILTSKGIAIARNITEKHKVLEKFLLLIGADEHNIYEEVERIEHYISDHTASCIINFVHFFQYDPSIKETFMKYIKNKIPDFPNQNLH